MESSTSPTNSRNSSPVNDTIHVSASSFIHAPLATLLEYSGVLRPQFHRLSTHPITRRTAEQVSIRIIGTAAAETAHAQGSDSPAAECYPAASVTNAAASSVGAAAEVGSELESGRNGRYDIQHVTRWIEQIMPFSFLLLIVFVRQHLQGFCLIIWITAVLFKSNDIVRKHTALKDVGLFAGERKISVLLGFVLLFTLHVCSIYWWYLRDGLLYSIVLLPPSRIPPFWSAVFVIMVNDAMVRQAAMVLKCLLLMYHKNSKGRDHRKQGQMLTLLEYLLLLYRALLPTPVWYQFFLNKEYGTAFSSFITGMYLAFKLTSVLAKVQHFFSAFRALSRKEVHYGSYATSEQVSAAGDLCAICQEKMHAPTLLRCKHIFCEDCVSEWFERERTCPLCRALVKPADIRSYSDGSTTLFFQLF